MRKLRIGTTIKQLNGRLQKFSEVVQIDGKEDRIERDMTLRDVIVDIYPILGGQKEANALIITDAVLKIHNCKEEWIELENYDYTVLKKALQGVNSLVWVQVVLAKAFEESDAAYKKKEADG